MYFENCRYRERKREKGIDTKKKSSKVLTTNEREKQRQYWRVKQKESRERRHLPKIRKEGKRQREAMEKKMKHQT